MGKPGWALLAIILFMSAGGLAVMSASSENAASIRDIEADRDATMTRGDRIMAGDNLTVLAIQEQTRQAEQTARRQPVEQKALLMNVAAVGCLVGMVVCVVMAFRRPRPRPA